MCIRDRYVILEVPSMLDLEVRLRISTVEYCTLSAGNGLAICDMNYNCAFKCGETVEFEVPLWSSNSVDSL